MAQGNKTHLMLVLLIASSLAMSGCELMEQLGLSDDSSGSVTTPPDFNVSTDPEDPPPNPGDTGTEPPVEPPVVDIEEGFLINGGDLKTASLNLELEFITLNRNGMKISFNHTCAGGVWEPYAASKIVASPLANQMIPVSVQFRDFDNRAGNCFRQQIIHDGMGPIINFTKYPLASLEEGSTAQVIADVTDALSEVTEVTCSLNGLAKPCFAGRNEVNITALPVGNYVFEVRGKDELGNSSQASVSWAVVSTTRRLSQDIRVNNYKKVDILVVIDNSGSMEYEQRNMGARTSNLLSVIRGLDYQIAVTTTDPRSGSSVVGGDGRFLSFVGQSGKYILDSTMDETLAQQSLSATLQRPETGSGSEQGIRQAYRVVDRYNANETKARAFFRDGAQFAVVLISDEDESDTTSKNDPENLIAHVNSSFGGQKMFSYHSIITKPGDTQCRQADGYAYGHRYQTMSQLTGGIIGSVCAADYADQVTGIAQGIRDLLKTLTLQCLPLADKPLVVKRNGVVISQSYQVQGVNLKFDTELEPGDYNVEYSCLKQ